MRRVLPAVAIAFVAAHCATMVNETTEKIPVRSTPAGAVVSVDCGSAPLYGGITPTTITVPRGAHPCSVTIAKEGYAEKRIEFQRQPSRASSANKTAAAPVGLVAAGLVGIIAGHIQGLNADAIASSVYSATTSVAAAPANAFDERNGAAFKQVPGEVDVTLDQQIALPDPATLPVPPP